MPKFIEVTLKDTQEKVLLNTSAISLVFKRATGSTIWTIDSLGSWSVSESYEAIYTALKAHGIDIILPQALLDEEE